MDPITDSSARLDSFEHVRARPSRRTAVVVGAVGILFVVVLGKGIFLLGNGPLTLDTWWHDQMWATHSTSGLALAGLLASIGGVGLMIYVGGIVVAALLVVHRPREASAVVAAMLVAEAVTANRHHLSKG